MWAVLCIFSLVSGLVQGHGRIPHIESALLAVQGQMEATMAPRIITTQAGPLCAAALISFNDSITLCKVQTDNLAWNNTNESTLLNATVDFCTTTNCSATLISKAVAVAVLCSATDIPPASRVNLRAFVALASAICIQDSAMNFCYPRMKRLEAASNTTLTAPILSGVCTECTVKFIAQVYLTGFGTREQLAAFGVLGAICMKDITNTTFCVLEWMALVQDAQRPPDDNVTLPNPLFLPRLCTHCARRYVNRVVLLITIFDPTNVDLVDLRKFRRWTGAWCAMTNDIVPQWCVPKVLAANASWNVVQTQCSSIATTCTTGCKQAIQNLSATVGCCLAPALNLLNPTSAVPFSWVVRAVVRNQCRLTLPSSCATKRLIMRIQIRNILWTYYNRNRTNFTAILANDIALELGVDVSRVAIARIASTFLPTTRRAGTVAGLDVISNVVCDNDDECTTAQVDFNNTDLDGPEITSATDDALANPSMGVQLTAMTSTGPSDGVGRLQAPIFVTMILIALASLFV